MAENPQICENNVMSVTMWKARHGGKIVQVEGMNLEEGAQYFSRHLHKGALTCAFCSAAIKYEEGPLALGGVGFKPPSSHFATERGSKHNDCLWNFRASTSSPDIVIDPEKGYRIQLNTMGWSEEFNDKISRYKRNEKGRYMKMESDLRNREPFNVTSAHDLIQLLRMGQFDRVQNARVLFLDHNIGWDEFCFHHKKYDALVARLGAMAAQGGNEQKFPIFMEMRIGMHYTSKDKRIDCPEITMDKADSRGRPQYIRTTAFKNDHRDSFLADTFTHGEGSYFVLGQVRYTPKEYKSCTVHCLNISLTDHRQVAKDDIHDIVRDVRLANAPPPANLFNWNR